jgi:hypothetical protein
MNFRKMVKISLQLLKLKHNFKSIQKLLKILKIDLKLKKKGKIQIKIWKIKMIILIRNSKIFAMGLID